VGAGQIHRHKETHSHKELSSFVERWSVSRQQADHGVVS